MPEPITMTIVLLLGVTAAVALTFWHKILGWAEESLFPWMERNLPTVADAVRQAFIALDNVAVAVRTRVQKAWQRVRAVLLGQMAEFARRSRSEWVRRIVTWVAKVLPSGEMAPAKLVVEQVVNWEDLPDGVREAFLRRKQENAEIDVMEMRDRELVMTH
jgi:hypothetical protein